MKAYHEYLELHTYFARGERKLSSEEFSRVAAEFDALAAKHPKLDAGDRERLAELKQLLYRDRP